jgi:hypothetical protein
VEKLEEERTKADMEEKSRKAKLEEERAKADMEEKSIKAKFEMEEKMRQARMVDEEKIGRPELLMKGSGWPMMRRLG